MYACMLTYVSFSFSFYDSWKTYIPISRCSPLIRD